MHGFNIRGGASFRRRGSWWCGRSRRPLVLCRLAQVEAAYGVGAGEVVGGAGQTGLADLQDVRVVGEGERHAGVLLVGIAERGVAAIKNSFLVASFNIQGPIDKPTIRPAPRGTLTEWFWGVLGIPKNMIGLGEGDGNKDEAATKQPAK